MRKISDGVARAQFISLVFFSVFLFSHLGLSMESGNYFSCYELEQILAACKKIPISLRTFQDRWYKINELRNLVSASLNHGLDDILQGHDHGAIVEIGCGIGYRFPVDKEKSIIRLQPNIMDFCGLVGGNVPNIYPLDVGQFCRIISAFPGKTVGRYIGINVFDCMPAVEREQNLKAISKTQNVGDKIFVVLDANPDLAIVIPEIISENPEMDVLPYIPLRYFSSEQFYRMSAILLPKNLNDKFIKMDAEIFENNLQNEKKLRHKDKISSTQQQLEWARSEKNLQVIIFEEYFAKKMIKLFADIGYEAKFYYHASFCLMNIHDIVATSEIEQPIVYKPISDTLLPVRQWSHKDKEFLSRLKHKNLALPTHCDDQFFAELLKSDQRLVGAELLVIEATKK